MERKEKTLAECRYVSSTQYLNAKPAVYRIQTKKKEPKRGSIDKRKEIKEQSREIARAVEDAGRSSIYCPRIV
jgi:hypothetical protein